MKLSVQNVIDAKEAMLNLARARSVDNYPIQGKLAYTIKRFHEKFVKEFNIVEPLRIELFKKFGTQDEKGMIKVFPEKLKEFQDEMKVFLENESEIEAPMIELGMVDGMSVNDIILLEKNNIIKDVPEVVTENK
jgi:iron-sulfur cluster repair protein YtfE (RIC family)